MRAASELFTLLSRDQPTAVEPAEVTVVPLAGAGMLTDPVDEDAEPPPGANYVARARDRHILVDADEMKALVDAGAAFDHGIAA